MRGWECRPLRVPQGTGAVLAAFPPGVSVISPNNLEIWALVAAFYRRETRDSDISSSFGTYMLWWLI